MTIETAVRSVAVITALCVVSMQLKLTKTQTTPNFRLRADRTVSQAAMTRAATVLDRAYKEYSAALGIAFPGRAEAIICGTSGQFQTASHSLAFNDADYRNGRLYITVGRTRGNDSALQHAAARVVVRALLERVPACPQWFAEAYSLYVGRALDRYGRPASVTLASFSDLGEEYSRANDAQQTRDVYAKLAATIRYLVTRYGDAAVREAVLKFKSGQMLEEVFEGTFKEKLPDIEKAWVRELQLQSKG